MVKMIKRKCPVCCRSSWIRLVKREYKFKNEFVTNIYDCMRCKARFIMPYKAGNVHEKMHSYAQTGSVKNNSYRALLDLGEKCAKSYRSNNKESYRKLLGAEKYSFVIDYILNNCNKDGKLLEIGCAEGYLTGYLSLEGYDVTGTDISETAIQFCKENYGDFFFAGDIRNLKGKKYDVIYHVGLIGEIDFPMSFIDVCIELLNDGGVMVFNAPNRFRLDEYWTETVPPDLRTLFTAETFRKLIKRTDVEVEFQYSENGYRGKLSNFFLVMKEEIIDFMNYRCFVDKNQYNLYLIIKKRGK